MRVYRTQAGNAEPSVHAHYLYGASGQRVKKLVRNQGGQFEVTIYVDSVFEHYRLVQSGATQENNTLHVMDNQSRIALVRVGTQFPDDTTSTVKFHVSDHLGSSNVVVDTNGELTNREEYTPYGETSFGSFTRKRYRFTGKERDEESRLYYHGRRYFAPWLARWVSCDPAGMVDGLNLYRYSRNSPLIFIDVDGTVSVTIALQRDPSAYKAGSEGRAAAIKENPAFLNQAIGLWRKMLAADDRFNSVLNPYLAHTGKIFLTSLVDASRSGPIKNLVVFGHSGDVALYPTTDRGLYRNRDDIVGKEPGAAHLEQLKDLVKSEKITFAPGAVVIFAGCNTAGKGKSAEQIAHSFARRFTEETGATTIAAVGGTDLSLARPGDIIAPSYGGWVISRKVGDEVKSSYLDIKSRSVKTAKGEPRNVYDLDPLNYLESDGKTNEDVSKSSRPSEIPIAFPPPPGAVPQTTVP